MQPQLSRAAEYLISAQEDNGDFPQQLICGVFNHNCMITYANYRNIFPIWALGEDRRRPVLTNCWRQRGAKALYVCFCAKLGPQMGD